PLPTLRACQLPLQARRPRRGRAFRLLGVAGGIRPRGGGSYSILSGGQATRLAPPPVGASPSARLSLPATPSCRQYSPPGRGLPHYSERWPNQAQTTQRSGTASATSVSGRRA